MNEERKLRKPSTWQELRRRRVIQVALIYIGSVFVALQAADILFKALKVPEWGVTMLVIVAIVGLPVVLLVVWASNAPVESAPAATAPPPLPTETAAPPVAETAPPSVPPARSASIATPRSVAVLPFVNMSNDPDNEFFSDGMTEELLNVLTKLGRFRVPARTSSFAFKGKVLDVRDVGRQLGVETVLEGSVRKAGDRVRITSQLINVDDGYHLWSETYDRELRDIFAIQDEIALCIVEALNVHLTDQEVKTIRKVPTHSVRAYEHYLKGRQFIYRFTRQSFAHARELFGRAIEIDPEYALAYAGIADCCSLLYMYWEHTDENLHGADEASQTALQHDPELAEAHSARGLALSLSKNFGEAERELKRAIELDPTLFEAYYFYARAAWAQGHLEEAAKMFEEANRVRPEDFQSLSLCSNVYHALGRLDDEKDAATRALAIIRRHLELYPDDVRARYLGAGSLILLGHREEGRAWLEQSLATDDPAVYYNVACGFVELGETERALDCLERAVGAGFRHREWAENDAELMPLKGNPRFEEILNRMEQD